jgi:archaellum component FlaG (FlaF/FlaG flagellin family)
MPTITSYLAIQKLPVEVLDYSDPTLKTRYRPVYSRPIKVYQGIDNPIQIVVKNQDQKPVNLTGYTIQVDIQDPINQTTAYSFAANGAGAYSNLTIGTTTLLFSAAVVNSLDQRFYKLTTRLINNADSTQAPLYIDDNFGVPLDLEVLPAYYASSTAVVNLGETIIDPGLLP